MWVIAKINTNEFSLFKNSINNANGSITEIYFPKIYKLETNNKKAKIYLEIIFFALTNILMIKNKSP